MGRVNDVTGRVVAITGGGRGIGLATARALRAAGAQVAIGDVDGKAAIVSLTETARVEHARRGVAFTCVMPSFTATELIAGTKGTRFVPTVAPDDVAAAIAAVVARPRADVYVPRSVGAILRTQPLLGRRLRDAINHRLGADRTFLDVDPAARAAYDERIRAPRAATSAVTEHAAAGSRPEKADG